MNKRQCKEELCYQIAEFLKKNCPVFNFTSSGTPYGKAGAVWHGCNCGITGESCECVWHRTNICHQGKWNMPFLQAYYKADKKVRQAVQRKMAAVPGSILEKREKTEG